MVIELMSINWWRNYKGLTVLRVTIDDWDYALLNLEVGDLGNGFDLFFILGIDRAIRGKRKLKEYYKELGGR